MTLRSQLGIEAYDYRKTSKTLSSHPSVDGIGTTTELFQRNSQFTITNTAEYKFDVNYDHHITLLAGQEGIKSNFSGFVSKTTGQNDDRLSGIWSGTSALLVNLDDYSGSMNPYSYAYLSFFGRAEYAYKKNTMLIFLYVMMLHLVSAQTIVQLLSSLAD